VRPQFILHTNEYQKQADHLTESDLNAAWKVLSSLGSEKGKGERNGYFVIYNCGFEGGSSIGHKHLQILPRPEREEFEFFPDVLGISSGKSLYSMSTLRETEVDLRERNVYSDQYSFSSCSRDLAFISKFVSAV
jgi:ATP adenylyltransferase/5',5'''-P-1,P-4-tetraphosphate phosphorylase II